MKTIASLYPDHCLAGGIWLACYTRSRYLEQEPHVNFKKTYIVHGISHRILKSQITEANVNSGFLAHLALMPMSLSNHELSLAHLALMPMSLSNHELSVMCWHPAPLSSLALSVDSFPSYRFDHRIFIFCTYAPSICTWIIKSMQPVFLNGSHFN